MRIPGFGEAHLTYCTNIHPADGWTAVFENLKRYAPPLKARFSPDAPFGIGLRLSAREARELRQHGPGELRKFLDDHGLYVAIINGFPHGAFHGTVVKADVYAPDWRDPARVRYTTDLIEILRSLLPDGMEGGISTAPLSYKPWMATAEPGAWNEVTRNVARIAAALARVRAEDGRIIHLDIEPEPDCALETSGETIEFFSRQLLPVGAPLLARDLGIAEDMARTALLEHVQVCFDCCHFAVEYEDPLRALDTLRAAGIKIGRVQLSSALKVPFPADRQQCAEAATRLHAFADPVYLHQVVERGPALRRFPDLGEALHSAGTACAREWRIHFHVPLFTSQYDGFESTQDYVRQVLDTVLRAHTTRHLEIETYTWDVLPSGLKRDLAESIAREYEWVLGAIPNP